MGGCRCNFRACENSTGSRPGMHFFHFPIKDSARCEQWIIYSNNPSFKNMEDKKLRNRNVCEEHFRVKMFMNIRKERLVRFAYPSLLKTKLNGKVYDLEKMQSNGCEIEDLSVNSNLDSYFDQFLVEDSENPILVGIQQPENEVAKEASFTLNEENIADIPVEFEQEKVLPEKEVKVLPNKLILTPVKKKAIKRNATPEGEIILRPVPIKKPKQIKILNSPHLMKTISTEPVKIQSSISSVSTNQIALKQETPVKSPPQNKELLEKLKKLTEERDKAITNEQKAKRDLIDSNKIISVLETKVEQLEEKLKLEVNKSKPPKISTISHGTQTEPEKKITPKVQTSPTAQTPLKPGTLSKPQLFNGIKRYLSNAMATLLKMEMFGNSEREWKADEKKISCEVMRLGKDVYEYFTDEWRLRLPSKSEVSNWMTDNADDDDEDLF